MIATATALELENLTLNITQEIFVDASLDVTFEALLEQLGPGNETPEGQPFPLKLEAWPGGRWFRDLGDNNGHFWAHVQAIKRPELLEFAGPFVHVVSGCFQCAISADGGERRNPDQVPSQGVWTDSGRSQTEGERWRTYINQSVRARAEAKAKN